MVGSGPTGTDFADSRFAHARAGVLDVAARIVHADTGVFDRAARFDEGFVSIYNSVVSRPG
jgi:hypothetical protein